MNGCKSVEISHRRGQQGRRRRTKQHSYDSTVKLSERQRRSGVFLRLRRFLRNPDIGVEISSTSRGPPKGEALFEDMA